MALLSTLLLNLSTLWSTRGIKQGGYVHSGYYSAIISSGSMEPAFSVNDLLLIEAKETYAVSDVITYLSPQDSLVTHRIKNVFGDTYIVQGDANNISDDAFSRQRVLGKVVWALPGVGGILKSILDLPGIVLLPCIFVVIWLIQKTRKESARAKQ